VFFDSGAVDSPSSPDASRDEAWSCPCADVFLVEDGKVVVRFLLPALEPADEGEDMIASVFVSVGFRVRVCRGIWLVDLIAI
jgi:hypothetical protein